MCLSLTGSLPFPVRVPTCSRSAVLTLTVTGDIQWVLPGQGDREVLLDQLHTDSRHKKMTQERGKDPRGPGTPKGVDVPGSPRLGRQGVPVPPTTGGYDARRGQVVPGRPVSTTLADRPLGGPRGLSPVLPDPTPWVRDSVGSPTPTLGLRSQECLVPPLLLYQGFLLYHPHFRLSGIPPYPTPWTTELGTLPTRQENWGNSSVWSADPEPY